MRQYEFLARRDNFDFGWIPYLKTYRVRSAKGLTINFAWGHLLITWKTWKFK